jgi:hypothetical protein
MLFQRIKRADPERVYIVVFNSYSAATLTNGQAVQWDFGTDIDGVGVTRPTARATNRGFATAGIVAESIVAGEYGLIQVYGYHAAVRCRACTSDNVIAPGTPLIMNLAGSVFCLESMTTHTGSGTLTQGWPCAFALEAYTSWSTKALKAFVKAL